MRILFVHSAAEWATFDVARGYREALERLGHDIAYEYKLYRRFHYHAKALGDELSADVRLLAKNASENIVCEALRYRPDLVLIVSGLSVHPEAVLMLRDAGFPVATIFTESPYDDQHQADFAAVYPGMPCFTNDRYSAARHGWTCLPPAFNPLVHQPVDHDPAEACDVLIVGTGWAERQRTLEAIDWTGINLRIRGLWTGITPDSPLAPFYLEGCIDNDLVPSMYAAAKICLNQHRAHSKAKSVNPRAMEVAACGAFQISDVREDVTAIFDRSVPMFSTPDQLEGLIRYYLAHDDERRRLAAEAHALVQPHTFDDRARVLVETVQHQSLAASAAVLA